MRLPVFLTLLFALFFAGQAQASERIHRFDAEIQVRTDGDVIVTETITLTAEHYQVSRGIFRDLPRYYLAETGEKFRYGYDVLNVTRNGEQEPYKTLSDGNAFQIRIGDADKLLPKGQQQTYKIRYRVKNQVRYFDDHDELMWNVTGDYWGFPIDASQATIILPQGVQPTFLKGYTGAYGESGSDYTASHNGNVALFSLTKGLKLREGFTIAVGLPKGAIDPPSAADKGAILWQRYAGLGLLLLSALGVFGFYFFSWQKVGQDAARLPVYPRYHPPKKLSPIAAHYVFFRTLKNNDGLIGTLMDLAVKGFLSLKVEKKKVTLTKSDPPRNTQLPGHERKFYNTILKNSNRSRTLGESYDADFASALSTMNSSIQKTYGDDYFRWNTGYMAIAIFASVCFFIIAAFLTLNWTVWHFVITGVLVVINLAFFYFLPAQTAKGEKLRSEIAGFRLYLETAEKDVLNAAEVHGDKPPPMSKDRYEALLPFAMALGVEKPWSKYFEKVLPEEARDYDPSWNRGGRLAGASLASFSHSVSSGISSGVSTAAVRPSSGSSSSGGGFSGGGGGGGGGGGW